MTWGDVAFWLTALAGHGFLWVEVVNRLHGVGWPRRLIDGITLLCGLLVVGLPIAIGWSLTGSAGEGWPTAYGRLAVTVLTIVLAGRVALRWDPARDRRTRRTDHQTLDLGMTLGDAATGDPRVRRLASMPGNRVLQPAVERSDVPLDRLPSELNGLRIAHLTDLHMSGRLSQAYFDAIVERVNEWSPDLVCLTGDLVEHTPQLEWVASTLGRLNARVGVYAVLGNHDAKVDCEALRSRLAGAGIEDVGGRLAEVEHAGVSLGLCGDERPWFPGEPDLGNAGGFTICLAHTPDRFGWAIEKRVDLVLAGHTHGGQVCFPLLGPLLCPSRHGVRYASGTFRRRGTVMHVSRGTGSLFPLRYGCPPEVTLMTLTAT